MRGLLIIIGLICNWICAAQDTQPPAIGNFRLPASQQPGPFFSFGQNIIPKNSTQLYLFPAYLRDTSQRYLSMYDGLVYGITDTASILLTVPVAIYYGNRQNHSAGLSDVGIQFEDAFYNNANSKYAEFASLALGVTFPTGSFTLNPPTGFGAPGYFVGGVYNRMYPDWMWFVSPGLVWVFPGQNSHAGSQYVTSFALTSGSLQH